MAVDVPPPLLVALHTASPESCEADFLVLPVFEQDDFADVAAIDEGTGRELSRALAAREFRARPFDLHVTGFTGRASRLVAVGAGLRDALTIERVRKVAGAGAWAARNRGARRVAWVARQTAPDVAAAVRAAADGLAVAALAADRHKSGPRELPALDHAVVVAPGRPELTAAVQRGALDGHATNVARWLSDEPGNVMTPSQLAESARVVLGGTGIEFDVLDESRLGELKMGLLLGVGRGSAEPPRLIVMRYTPPSGPTARVLGLVGKGVTFDTGGISIKPADQMEKMKHDMSGGAAVIAAMRAIAALKPAVSVIGVVPAVENMPGGRALKPGDILVSAAGKTVEVINTDAEGRLILGDALWYARQQGATHLVDVATLTGACAIALGKICSGLFGTHGAWLDAVRNAAARVGERVWQLPVDDDYKDLLKSDYADIANSGGRAGGAIAAAMFLREFVADVAWAHLDVAGTAWLDEGRPWQPRGATGVTVRTMLELATSAGAWA